MIADGRLGCARHFVPTVKYQTKFSLTRKKKWQILWDSFGCFQGTVYHGATFFAFLNTFDVG